MKLSERIAPCVTCGKPVFWMAQHRACWQREREQGITADTARRLERVKLRDRQQRESAA